MNRNRLIAALVGVVVVVLVAVVAVKKWGGGDSVKPGNGGGNGKPAVVSIRLPLPIIEAGATPVFVAADKGFYAEEGLDVKVEMGSRELNPVKTVATGADTFGL